MHDVIIKNGTIFDGSGSAPTKADLAIDREKINGIGNFQNAEATLTIDAKNLYIAPGFIDLTTHSDNHWTLFSQPSQESFLRQGVTTILGGHGGSSLAPIINKDAIGSIEKWADPNSINVNWQTLEEFFSELKKHSLKINFGTLTGHETLRRNVLNNQARKADREEIKQMILLLEQTLKEGSFGLSTNLGTLHGQAATDEEIIALLKTTSMAKAISAHHLENEGKNILPALSRLITLLRKSGAKGHISHFKAIGRSAWQYFENSLQMIKNARNDGISLSCDFFPYIRTGSNLSSLLPVWALLGSKEKIIALFKNKMDRQKLKNHLKELTLHYDKITVASAPHTIDSVGKTIKEISQISGLGEEDVILNLLEVNDLRVAIFNEVIKKENIEMLAAKNYSMVASDGVGYDALGAQKSKLKIGLPHPRSFGAFPRAFNWLVKEKKILSWEEAIHKMSGLPAAVLELKNRGLLKKNYYADIVIFDPETIKDTATYENPFSYPKGIDFVFVNGVLTVAGNELKNEKTAGKIIKKE